MPDLYQTLGVPPDATPDEIKAAGRRAQKRTHPDAGGDAEQFRVVTKALAVLLDPERRAHYDRTGSAEDKTSQESENAQAMDVLAQMMARAMEGDARYTHLPNETRRLINENITKLKAQYGQIETQSHQTMARIDAYLKRLKKKQGDDMMRAVLEGQRSAIPRDLAQRKAQLQQFLKINSMALEMLADYEYELERPEQQPTALQRIIMQEVNKGFLRP